jgi:uncharacterized caspase-like protein
MALAMALLPTQPVYARNMALLIGVGDYAMGEQYDLEGPTKDAVSMRDVLVARWGVAPQDATVLTDKAATKENILQALRVLAQRSQPGDDIVIFFSGHPSEHALQRW